MNYMGAWFRPAIDYPAPLVDHLPGQGIDNPYWLCRCCRCAARYSRGRGLNPSLDGQRVLGAAPRRPGTCGGAFRRQYGVSLQ